MLALNGNSVFCFLCYSHNRKSTPASARKSLNPRKVFSSIPILTIKQIRGQASICFMVSMGGLEPPRISPHAPQTCAYTDSATTTHTITYSIIKFLSVFVADVVSSTTLSKNPQRFGFFCGRVPLRHILDFQIPFLLLVSIGGTELSLPSIQNLTFSQLLHRVLATTTRSMLINTNINIFLLQTFIFY